MDSIFNTEIWEIAQFTAKQWQVYIDGLAQDCSNSIAFPMELLQSSAKWLIYNITFITGHGYNKSHIAYTTHKCIFYANCLIMKI